MCFNHTNTPPEFSYKGAYASDFEAPSASGSKVSSDSEVSGDEEEETEEDESDAESNTSSSGINQLRIISCKLFVCFHTDNPKVSQLIRRGNASFSVPLSFYSASNTFYICYIK